MSRIQFIASHFLSAARSILAHSTAPRIAISAYAGDVAAHWIKLIRGVLPRTATACGTHQGLNACPISGRCGSLRTWGTGPTRRDLKRRREEFGFADLGAAPGTLIRVTAYHQNTKNGLEHVRLRDYIAWFTRWGSWEPKLCAVAKISRNPPLSCRLTGARYHQSAACSRRDCNDRNAHACHPGEVRWDLGTALDGIALDGVRLRLE